MKNKLDSLFFARLFVSEQKQIALIADENLRFSSYLRNKLLRMEIGVKILKSKIFHTALCAAGATKSLFIAEPNKIWLAIPPALKCLRNGD